MLTCFRILADDGKYQYREFVAQEAFNATSSSSVPIVNAEEIHSKYDGILCDLHSELHLLKSKDSETTTRMDANLVQAFRMN